MDLRRRHPVTKTYDARLATRITTSVDTRLRQLALLHRRRISHLLNDVLDAVLPTSEDLAAQFAHLTSPGPEPSPQHPPADAQPAAGTEPGPTLTRTPPR
jgi:hypothetical protein